VGTNDGNLVRIQTNDGNFAGSVVDTLVVAPGQRLSTVEVDSLRGYLYTTTPGATRFDPAVLYKINLVNFTVESSLTLNTFDFSVSTSAIVDNLAGTVV